MRSIQASTCMSVLSAVLALFGGGLLADVVQAQEQSAFWIGLKDSDDQGTRFDLRTEFYVKGELVATGETRCITGVTRNPNKAKLVTVDLAPVLESLLVPGDELSLKVRTRIGTNPDDTKCLGHASASGLRLYYDAVNRASGFSAELVPDPLSFYFLHVRTTAVDSLFFTALPPTSSTAKQKDSTAIAFAGGNPWVDVGAWRWKVLPPWLAPDPVAARAGRWQELPEEFIGTNNCGDENGGLFDFGAFIPDWDHHPDAGCLERPGEDGWIVQHAQKLHSPTLNACDFGPGDAYALRICRLGDDGEPASEFPSDLPCIIELTPLGGCARCLIAPTCH